MRPKVTVVIPNYNSARYLRQLMESLLGQRFGDFRIAFVDNCSTDDSVAIAESYRDPRIRVARNAQFVTMSENWSLAAAHADSPFFLLAHSDDVYEADYLQTMVPLLEGRPYAFMAHCKTKGIDENGFLYDAPQELYKGKFWPKEDPGERPAADELRSLQRCNYIIAPSVLYRTQAFRRIGPYTNRFQFVTDWEYWMRGTLSGYTIVGTHQKLMCYRRHRDSCTSQHAASYRRYREELEIAEWIAREAYKKNLTSDNRPNLDHVKNTLTSEFVDRLASGDRSGAHDLLQFGVERIPKFRNSLRRLMLRIALSGGKCGGAVLKLLERCYLTGLRLRFGRY